MPISSVPRPTSRGVWLRGRLAWLLAVVMAAGALSAVSAAVDPLPASAASAAPASNVRYYVQSLANGSNMSGTPTYPIDVPLDDVLTTRPPKGDEDNQQWEFQALSGGGYEIALAGGGPCVSRVRDLIMLGGCGDADAQWFLEHIGGDRYAIYRPSDGQRLRVDTTTLHQELTVTTGKGSDTVWYLTPTEPARSPMPSDSERTFDQMTYLTTHNSMSNTEQDAGHIIFPNQPHSILTQLNDGVRGLMVDVYDQEGRIVLCHKPDCSTATRQAMTVPMGQIGSFLRSNPREIVTIFMEDHVSGDQLSTALGGLLGERYSEDTETKNPDGSVTKHPAGSVKTAGSISDLVFDPRKWKVKDNGWPKVQDMIDAGNRLVMFSQGDDKESLGIMHDQDWTVENYWSMGPTLGSSDWTCRTRWGPVPLSTQEYADGVSGAPKNFRPLFVMNHFHDVPMDPTYRRDNEKLQDRAERFCMPAARKKPTFLAVDQYRDGNPMAAVTALNAYTYRGEPVDASSPPPSPGPAPLPTPTPGDPQWKVPRLAVMPLGDSITLGVGSSTGDGYRPGLWSRLQGHGENVDFVGSLSSGNLPDTDHEGHSGWFIGGIHDNIGSWLYRARPNAVTLKIGTNDINKNIDVANAPARLKQLIDRIRASAPAITVAVATIVPNADNAAQARVVTYNNAVRTLVSAYQAQGAHVELADTSAVTTADLSDGLHPNNAGYAKIATAFYDALTRAAGKGWIAENVIVKPALPESTTVADSDVDLDADGRADYLVVGANGSLRAFLNKAGANGAVTWSDLGYIATGSPAWTGSQIRFADLDGDGRSDYLVVGANGATQALLNRAGANGAITWSDLGYIATGSPAWTGGQIRFADLDGDGRSDYLAVGSNGSVHAYRNSGTGATVTWEDLGFIAAGSTGWTDSRIRFADYDGDRKADYLVIGDNGSVRVLLNKGGDGNGGWSDLGVVATGSSSWTAPQIRMSDLDADGRADYLVVGANGSLRAFLNQNGWADQGAIATGSADWTASQIHI
ncbi:FG-GAP-like repeat-containing protein [Streptomyces polyrhachis]|uniref:FG-GAP-like repeat-containing protein n=1 Tax=Streptomyces polyrhachis TaxID=1282885 RepID=A0ABW2GFI0_9ACTN